VHFQRIPIISFATICCAALTSTISPAATLRMVIQSPPEVGGKCLDVPNNQLVPGIRLQMWDCNNTIAQTFTYDETSQQLTIGNLCVESWGRGDPGDAVGLGSCNGQANQRWKMLASKDYYQIIGINNRCLALRYAVKDNGAPLNVQDCDVGSPHRLWALLETPNAAENEAAPVVGELKLTRSAQSGVDTLISYSRNWDRNCNPQPLTVTITRPPLNGIASFVQGTSIIPESTPRSGSTGPCAGKSIIGYQLMYRSSSGFHGIDTVSYEAMTGDGRKTGPTTITINVQ